MSSLSGLPREVLWQAVAESASAVSVSSADGDHPLLYVNDAFERLSGYPAAEVLGRNCRVLQAPDADPETRAQIAAALRHSRPLRVRLLNQRPDGRRWWNELRLSYVLDADGRATHILGLQHDVTDLVQDEQRLQALAYRDPLTGLPNRHQLTEHLTLALARARRTSRAVALLYVDLDAFKAVNDVHGHAGGDRALREVAARLRQAVRGTDLVCRHGGDEFVVLLADLPLEQAGAAAAVVAGQVARALARPLLLPAGSVTLRASTGISRYPQDAPDQQQLLEFADRAMYLTKRSATMRPGSSGLSRDQEAADDVPGPSR